MIALQGLLACSGCWRGTNLLQVSGDGPVEESPSDLVITALSNGRFVRVDQTWAWRGRRQDGSLLVGFDDDIQIVTAHWIDTFHVGENVMACTGVVCKDGTFDLLGGYPAPPGPDWKWRIAITPLAPSRFDIEMFNVDPSGNEVWAVRATHAPA